MFSGLSTAWRLAIWPTSRSPVLVKATTDGVRRLPSLLMMTVGFPPSMTATTEFVVPRSIPIAFAMTDSSSIKKFDSQPEIFSSIVDPAKASVVDHFH